jgi:hypothetical protein
MRGIIKTLVTVLLLVHVIDIICLSATKNYLSRTARGTTGTVKMSIFDFNGNKLKEEMLKIEHEKLKLKARELEMDMVKFNITKEMDMVKFNITKEMDMVKFNNTNKIDMVKFNITNKMSINELNSKIINARINNVICVFAITAFLIFSVQLRDGLLGKITTLTSLVQSFYDFGINIKSLVVKLSAKLKYGFAAVIIVVVVVVLKGRGLGIKQFGP